MRNCDIKCKKRNTNYDCSGRGKSKPPIEAPAKCFPYHRWRTTKDI